MKKTGELSIKNSLSLHEIGNMTQYIVNGFFIDGEYTPYYEEVSRVCAFFLFCVNGVQFDENDSIYDLLSEDEDLAGLYHRFNNMYGNHEYDNLRSQIVKINAYVDDMVTFRKQCIASQSSSVEKLLIEILEKESRNKDLEFTLGQKTAKLVEEQTKQAEIANSVAEFMTPEEIAAMNKAVGSGTTEEKNAMIEQIVNKYFDSAIHENKHDSILQAKEKKIIELTSKK